MSRDKYGMTPDDWKAAETIGGLVVIRDLPPDSTYTQRLQLPRNDDTLMTSICAILMVVAALLLLNLGALVFGAPRSTHALPAHLAVEAAGFEQAHGAAVAGAEARGAEGAAVETEGDAKRGVKRLAVEVEQFANAKPQVPAQGEEEQ